MARTTRSALLSATFSILIPAVAFSAGGGQTVTKSVSTAFSVPNAIQLEASAQFGPAFDSDENATSGMVSVEQFDPSLGTLCSVRVQIIGTGDFIWDCTWDDELKSCNWSARGTISSVQGLHNSVSDTDSDSTDTLPGDPSGSEQGRFGDDIDLNLDVTLSTNLASWTGNGFVSWLIESELSGGIGACDNNPPVGVTISGGSSGFILGDIIVTYTYIPAN